MSGMGSGGQERNRVNNYCVAEDGGYQQGLSPLLVFSFSVTPFKIDQNKNQNR